MTPKSTDARQIAFERRLLEQNVQTAQVLGTAIAMRDHATGAHNFRVALYAGALGDALEFDELNLRALIAGAFLHDIGKIATPDRILLKPAALTEEEAKEMRRHTELGAQLLEELPAFHQAIAVVRHHHERYDGTGYPDALAGKQIPMVARAFALVDVFDALASDRPYKTAFPLDRAMETLRSGIGRHFDPHFAASFLRLIPQMFEQYGSLSEEALKPRMADMRRRHFGA